MFEVSPVAKSQEILRSVRIGVPAEKVFSLFSSASALCSWWAKQARVDLRVGGFFSIDEGEGRLLEVRSSQKLKFHYSQLGRCKNSVVVLEFIDSGESSRVLLHHEPLSEADAHHMGIIWDFMLAALKSFAEKGERLEFETWFAPLQTRYAL